MINKYEAFFYTFDLFGIIPQLRIFSFWSYKSKFSTIISIIFFLISLGLSIFFIYDFFQFDNPLIIYSKYNDEKTNRTLLLKDTLLIFGIIDATTNTPLNKSEAFYEIFHYTIYYNGTHESFPITLGECEYGKNVNLRYKDLLEKKIFHNNNLYINNFYCVTSEYENLSISNFPNIGESGLLLYTIVKQNNTYEVENIQSVFYFENNLIDHYNKSNPISDNYVIRYSPSYSSELYTEISCSFQYIKYESDEGLIFKDNKFHDAKMFSNLFYNKYYMDGYKNIIPSNIGMINIGMDNFFEHYKRTYDKLQTLLAEISSMISLLFNIGNCICNFILRKKMAKDMVYDLFSENSFHHNKLPKINKIFNNIFKENTEIEINNTLEKNEIEKTIIKTGINTDIKKLKKEKSKKEKEKEYLKNLDIIKNITLFNITKSYFCCKDKKTQLINNCYEFVCKEISIDGILKKIYKLEKIYYSHLEKDKNKNVIYVGKDNKYLKSNKNLNAINEDTKRKQSKEHNKNGKNNLMIKNDSELAEIK